MSSTMSSTINQTTVKALASLILPILMHSQTKLNLITMSFFFWFYPFFSQFGSQSHPYFFNPYFCCLEEKAISINEQVYQIKCINKYDGTRGRTWLPIRVTSQEAEKQLLQLNEISWYKVWILKGVPCTVRCSNDAWMEGRGFRKLAADNEKLKCEGHFTDWTLWALTMEGKVDGWMAGKKQLKETKRWTKMVEKVTF